MSRASALTRQVRHDVRVALLRYLLGDGKGYGRALARTRRRLEHRRPPIDQRLRLLRPARVLAGEIEAMRHAEIGHA